MKFNIGKNGGVKAKPVFEDKPENSKTADIKNSGGRLGGMMTAGLL